MLLNYKTLPELIEHFKDESICVSFLEEQRWNGKVVCPHCEHEKVYRTNRGFKCASPSCYKKFTVITQTYFESTKCPLRTWFIAIYLVTAHKKGISSAQLARDLGCTQRTAWFLLHRIRLMMANDGLGQLEGIIEADEVYIGGLEKNKHKQSKSGKLGRATVKTPVLAMVERKGRVKAMKLKNVKSYSLTMPIFKHVKEGSTVITDAYNAYSMLPYKFKHETVNHSKNEFVRGSINTNTVEGFFSLLKRGIIGIYHQVSVKHLDKYCGEFAYRYNTRTIKDTERFSQSITQLRGRLKYKDLIKDEIQDKPI